MTTLPAPDDRPARTTRCWTIQGDEGLVDVEVLAADDHRVAEVLPLLHRALGVSVPGLWSGSAQLDPDSPLSSPALRHGAVLGLRPPPGTSLPPSPVELRVAGGPDAGRSLPLGRGSHLVGRDGGCDVRILDPDISRRHLEVRVGGGAVQVRDVGSTNGSLLGDARLDGGFREWPPDARLRLGATTLAITRGTADRPAAQEACGGGRSLIRPPHVLRGLREEREVTLPRPPAEAPRLRLAWVAVLLPATGGALLAWLLDTPTFLFFALLSPLVGLGTWASDRWSGRRSTRQERAAYRDELASAQEELQVAVRADVRAAERDHPDPANLRVAVRRRTDLVWSRRSTGTDPLLVRVGTGPGPVRVTRLEDDGRPAREMSEHVPVCVDLTASGGLAVIGPRARALGAVRAVLAQLVALHAPDGLGLVLLTTPVRLADWTWARWSPHLPPSAVLVDPDGPGSTPGGRSLRAVLTGPVADRAAGPAVRSVVVVDRRVDGRTAALLHAAREVGAVCITTAEQPAEVPVAVDASLTLAGETASSGVLAQDRSADRSSVLVDRITADLAGEVARDLADLVPAGSSGTLPTEVRLLELPGWSALPRSERQADGGWRDHRDALRTTLGRSADGPVLVDLCREGPHALVAGTTGSGKSELLQSLIAGLALNHPPERCSFLLVDYKGGAAFAEAARLPHTVGMLTDLDGSTTARALRSLTAELSRREALLAAHGVADLAALPATVPLARLVIVVDEFATLVEELPAFVPGLIGIAQRGRSLGIHLVLATQRPGGVVSPEIRANCTLRICLRTTDEADSRDVVGTAAAAQLPVHVPGRAFLRTGSGEPRLFQVGRVALPVESASSGPEVRRWSWPRPDARAGRPGTAAVTDLARVVDALSRAAQSSGTPAPHRPWQPPLPDRLPQADLDATAPQQEADPADRAATGFHIGLVDRPDRQAREPLSLDLAVGGGVLAVGGPRSGRTTFLRTVLRSATAQLGPEDLHVHVLETAGGELCAEAAALPHTGTAISGADAFRAVRLLDRLNREVDARRAAPPGSPAPLVLVLLDGMEAAGALLDEAKPGRGSDALLRLVRDGAAVGVTCLLTADRALPGGRVATAARMRLLLPLPDRADYAVAGIPARAVPAHRPPGRALLGEDALECQLALPRPPAPRATGHRSGGPAPVRIVDLPPDPVLPAAAAAPGDLPGQRWRLAIGPGGDDGAPVVVDLDRSGGLLVLGPSRSGRTAALEAFAGRLAAAGAEVVRLFPPHAPPAEGSAGPWLDAADAAGLLSWVEGLRGGRGVLLADDLGTTAEYAGLTALPRIGPRTRVALLAAGSPSQLASHYQGPVAALRRARTGLLLCPGPADAEAVGLRLPRLPLPARPGSGWLVTDGVPLRVQVARTGPRPAPGGRAPQSSSSAGPSSCVAYQPSS